MPRISAINDGDSGDEEEEHKPTPIPIPIPVPVPVPAATARRRPAFLDDDGEDDSFSSPLTVVVPPPSTLQLSPPPTDTLASVLQNLQEAQDQVFPNPSSKTSIVSPVTGRFIATILTYAPPADTEAEDDGVAYVPTSPLLPPPARNNSEKRSRSNKRDRSPAPRNKKERSRSRDRSKKRDKGRDQGRDRDRRGKYPIAAAASPSDNSSRVLREFSELMGREEPRFDMPHNFTKRDLDNPVLMKNTDLSVKPDGKRMLLFIDSNAVCHWIVRGGDSTVRTMQVNEMSVYTRIPSQLRKTIFDGEGIQEWDQTGGATSFQCQMIYMVFDVLVHNGGKPVCSSRKERYELSQTLVREVFASVNATLRGRQPEVRGFSHPIYVTGKPFVPIASLPLFLRSHVFILDKDTKKPQSIVPSASSTSSSSRPLPQFPISDLTSQYNDSSELLFMDPNEPWMPLISCDGLVGDDGEKVFKWKPPPLITSDFQIRPPSQKHVTQFELWTHVLQTDFCTPYLAICAPENKTLAIELERAFRNLPMPPIAECNFHIPTGTWHIQKLRADKTHANHLNTILNGLECMISPVRLHDLLKVALQIGSDTMRGKRSVPLF